MPARNLARIHRIVAITFTAQKSAKYGTWTPHFNMAIEDQKTETAPLSASLLTSLPTTSLCITGPFAYEQ